MTQRIEAPNYSITKFINGKPESVPMELTMEQLLINELLDRVEALEALAGLK